MTPAEVRALYAKIVAYDNRRPSEANLAAWTEQANDGRWTLQEALDAVREHHRTSRDFLMPVHVHDIIRAARRRPAQYVAQIDGPEPAAETTRDRIMAMVGRHFDMPRGMRRDRDDGRRPEVKAKPKSADHGRKLEQARAELERLREQQGSRERAR